MVKQIQKIIGDTQRNNIRPVFDNKAWQTDGVNDFALLPASIVDVCEWDKDFSISFLAKYNLGTTRFNLDLVKSLNTFESDWNGNTNFQVFYISIDNNLISLGWQTNNTNGTQSAFPSVIYFNSGGVSKYNHWVINYQASPQKFIAYLNSIKVLDAVCANVSNLRKSNSANVFGCIGHNKYNTAQYWQSSNLVDFMIKNSLQTEADIRNVFHQIRSTNYSNYPSSFLSGRQVHYALGSLSDFDNGGASGLRALDISGNNRHAEIYGQGFTPTLVSI